MLNKLISFAAIVWLLTVKKLRQQQIVTFLFLGNFSEGVSISRLHEKMERLISKQTIQRALDVLCLEGLACKVDRDRAGILYKASKSFREIDEYLKAKGGSTGRYSVCCFLVKLNQSIFREHRQNYIAAILYDCVRQLTDNQSGTQINRQRLLEIGVKTTMLSYWKRLGLNTTEDFQRLTRSEKRAYDFRYIGEHVRMQIPSTYRFSPRENMHTIVATQESINILKQKFHGINAPHRAGVEVVSSYLNECLTAPAQKASRIGTSELSGNVHRAMEDISTAVYPSLVHHSYKQ